MADIIIYSIFSSFGIFFFISSAPLLSKISTAKGLGPGSTPFFIAALLCVIAIFQLITSIIKAVKGEHEIYTPVYLASVSKVLGMLVACVVGWKFIGFYFVAVILIFGLMKILHVFSWKIFVGYTLLFMGAMYGLFSFVLQVNL